MSLFLRIWVIGYSGLMARMPRVEFDGALYHLLCRGDRREAIFLDERDSAKPIQPSRSRTLTTMAEVYG